MNQVGRNERCPCGSGVKFKKCCGAGSGLARNSILQRGHDRIAVNFTLQGPPIHEILPEKLKANSPTDDFRVISECFPIDWNFDARFQKLASGAFLASFTISPGLRASGKAAALVQVLEETPGGVVKVGCSCTPVGRPGSMKCAHLDPMTLALGMLHKGRFLFGGGIQGVDMARTARKVQLDFDAVRRVDRPEYQIPSNIKLDFISFELPAWSEPLPEPVDISTPPQVSAEYAPDWLPVRRLAGRKPARSELIPVAWRSVLPHALDVERHWQGDIDRLNRKGLGDWANLKYHFSDGLVLDFGDLLEHPRLTMLPSALLPEQAVVAAPEWTRIPPAEARAREEARLVSLMRHLSCLLALPDAPPIYILNKAASGPGRFPVVPRLRKLSFELSPSPGISLKWRKLKATSDCHWEVDSGGLNQICRFESDPRGVAIVVSSVAENAYRLRSMLGGGIYKTESQAMRPLSELRPALAARGFPVPSLLEPVVPPQGDIISEVHIHGDSNVTLAHVIRSAGIRTWRTAPGFGRVCQALQVGLLESRWLEESRSASTGHSQHPAEMLAERKVLRHPGVIAYIVFEKLLFELEGRNSHGEVLERSDAGRAVHDKWLQSRILELIKPLLKTPLPGKAHASEALKDWVGGYGADLLMAFVSWLGRECMGLDDEPFFVGGRCYKGHPFFLGACRVLLTALSVRVRSDGMKFFKKNKPIDLFSSLEQPCQSNEVVPERLEDAGAGDGVIVAQRGDLVFHLPSPLESLMGLGEQGFPIVYHGRLLNEMQDQDLQAVFRLEEHPESALRAIDWFELHPKVFFHGREISLAEMQGFLNRGIVEHQGRYYFIPRSRLPSFRRLVGFWERLRSGQAGRRPEGQATERYRLPRSETLEFFAIERDLGARLESGSISAQGRWEKIRRAFHALDEERALPEAPAGFGAVLKTYQKAGLQWFRDLHGLGLGGVLADDMGLGKTVQTLAFLSGLQEEGILGQSLIFVPTSLAGNWLAEGRKFAPSLRIEVFDPRRKSDIDALRRSGQPFVLIVTYGLMVNHEEWLAGAGAEEVAGPLQPWNCVIFDEAQNLKNHHGKRAESARRIPAEIRFCLTGTPLENHLGELHAILDLAAPGALGDVKAFNTRYQVSTKGAMPSREDLAFLRSIIRPLVKRRTKSEVLSELPAKSESLVVIPLEEQQKKIYRDVALAGNKQVLSTIDRKGEGSSQLEILAALLRLRQVCSDPAAVVPEKIKKSFVPPKFELLLDSIPEIIESGESVLVFTQFMSSLQRIRRDLGAIGVPVDVIHGGISREERMRVVERYQDPDSPARVLVMTMKAGGVGLNLTRASYVFHFEPWWNPAAENQATDRAHRMGQTRPVQVYRYVMQETVEEKIQDLKLFKSSLFDGVMAEAESSDPGELEVRPGLRTQQRGLSKSDFEALIGSL